MSTEKCESYFILNIIQILNWKEKLKKKSGHNPTLSSHPAFIFLNITDSATYQKSVGNGGNSRDLLWVRKQVHEKLLAQDSENLSHGIRSRKRVGSGGPSLSPNTTSSWTWSINHPNPSISTYPLPSFASLPHSTSPACLPGSAGLSWITTTQWSAPSLLLMIQQPAALCASKGVVMMPQCIHCWQDRMLGTLKCLGHNVW